MKQLVILLMVGFLYLPLNAQRIIEKNIGLNNRTVSVDVKFASDIKVKTWDKSTVYFKAEIMTEGEKYLDMYKLDVKESSSSITITSETKAIFKALQEERDKNRPDGKKRYYFTYQMYQFDYTLYVPKNANFSVSSINGDLQAEIIEGDFTADLINGTIDIKKYKGDLDLKTINGEIDVTLTDTTFSAETVHGQIYADEKLDLQVTDRHVGQKVKGNFGNATNSLRLDTVNGNMYLRL
ncbi:hypothetical protein LV716_06390 [Flagellimonas sp. HMM57]|uniref:hypothetical protein n=1 Tax=unclassified Flagellimonas TaxID=2644544 RepID=UPI0013D19204|nr:MULTISPECIES: hypothetical protein [unclassified Flagellimonas]UII77396.1 hypothetical protein LV716_06390 [Flagellimonas sp. HMM57]